MDNDGFESRSRHKPNTLPAIGQKILDTSQLDRLMRLIGLILLLILYSCSSDIEAMNDWENQMADKLKAERVELFHRSSTTKTDGRLTASENYLLFDIYNSKVLTDIKHNDRLLNEKCQELADYILSLESLSDLPDFNEFRIDINETRGFSIFKTKTTKTITYKIKK